MAGISDADYDSDLCQGYLGSWGHDRGGLESHESCSGEATRGYFHGAPSARADD